MKNPESSDLSLPLRFKIGFTPHFSTPWAWSKAGDLKETQSSLKQSQADCGNPYENEKSWIDYIDKYIYIYIIYYIDNLDVYNYDW